MNANDKEGLVDGQYGISDLIDLNEFRRLCENFTKCTGFTVGFLDHPGLNILIATGWRDICTKFHRSCPESAAICLKSNRRLLDNLDEPGKLVIEQCENGLVDCAFPVIVKGKHIASLATGQLLIEKPDRERFKRQARLFGYDELEYLRALDEEPVISEEKLLSATAFLGEMALFLSELGYARITAGEEADRLRYEIAFRKETEYALRESEARLNEAQRMAKIGSWERDPLTDRLIWSDEIFRIFEIDPEHCDSPLEAFWEAIHPEDRDAVNAAYTESISNRIPYEITHRLLMPDGRMKYVTEQCKTLYSSEGKPIRSVGTVQDITEQKNADLALCEAENRYHLLFDQSPDGILIIDPETGRFLDFNEAACKIVGYSRDEFAQLTLADFLLNEKPEEIKERQKKIMIEGRDDFEDRCRTRQGGIRNIYVTVQATEISGRPVLHSVARDITESRRLQDQLRQAQKIEGLGQMAGGIAHDFNNVLSAIMGLTEMCIMDMAEDDPARHHAEEALKAVMRGTELTRQILAFSRQQALEMRPVNINSAVRDLQKMLRRLVREDITINLKLSDKELIVMADKAQIDQLFINLSANAGDAMHGGGNIDISTDTFFMDERFVATHGYGSPGNYAHITFSDTGCGMDAEIMANMFDPFFTTKEKGKGTGLGLAVVHGILKQHNGHIHVCSEPGKGASFNMYLPLTVAAVEKAESSQAERPRGGTETILIAEDDDLVRDITASVLTRFGYKVIEAVDGDDAIHKFSENSGVVDLVILDGIMPKKNGREAFEAISSLRPEIKAIFMSGYTDGSFDFKKLSGMGTIFMQKPVNPTELLCKVRKMLDAV
jgi:two-component system, cell cycle sensor histidine kinase and response regulator CckA